MTASVGLATFQEAMQETMPLPMSVPTFTLSKLT